MIVTTNQPTNQRVKLFKIKFFLNIFNSSVGILRDSQNLSKDLWFIQFESEINPEIQKKKGVIDQRVFSVVVVVFVFENIHILNILICNQLFRIKEPKKWKNENKQWIRWWWWWWKMNTTYLRMIIIRKFCFISINNW